MAPDRRGGGDRRQGIDRRSLYDRRTSSAHRCQVVLASGRTCARPALVRGPEVEAWLCLEHLPDYSG